MSIRESVTRHGGADLGVFDEAHGITPDPPELGRQASRDRSTVFLLREQPELGRVTLRFREPQMPEGMRGDQTSARSALQKTALDQERLDDLLDGIARLG